MGFVVSTRILVYAVLLELLAVPRTRIAIMTGRLAIRTLLASTLWNAVVEGIDSHIEYRAAKCAEMNYVHFRPEYRVIVYNPNSTSDPHNLQLMALIPAATSTHSPSASLAALTFPSQCSTHDRHPPAGSLPLCRDGSAAILWPFAKRTSAREIPCVVVPTLLLTTLGAR